MDSPFDELKKMHVNQYVDIKPGIPMIVLAVLDLAAQVEKLRERMERLDNLHSIMSCHIVPEMKPKFGPVLDDAKPAPEDAEPRTCHDCKYYAGGLCHAYSRQVSADAHICNGFKPAPEDAPLPHHGYTIEVPVYVDGMMQVWVPMPEGCAVPRVFIGHASWFKGWRESK